jgi:hypothetical protein
MKIQEKKTDQTINTEQLSPVLEKLKQDVQVLKVPDGYFDSLSPRIVDRIQKQENRSFSKRIVLSFRKPLIWAPAFATVVVTVLLIFVIPAKKVPTIQVVDEWTEINMAYDASYAEEAVFSESITIDKELANSVLPKNESLTFSHKEPTTDEIKAYLKEHETETDILIEY